MKKNPYYRLEYIADIPHLITHGQGNADYKQDLQLNETGVFLWNHCETVSTPKELVALCAEHYNCSGEQYPTLTKTVSHFINDLYYRGILLPENPFLPDVAPCKTVKIAGLFLQLFGPEDVFFQNLSSFETTEPVDASVPAQKVHVCFSPQVFTQNGTMLLRNKSLSVLENSDYFILLFPEFTDVREAHISKCGQNVTIFCSRPLSQTKAADIQEEISFAMRICFFYYAGRNRMLALHSSSILYQDKIWLFSAPSGMGKSTHADLWHRMIGVPVINGDINLIALTESGCTVHGIPWCGTSGIYSTDSYPLGGVLFLEKGTENTMYALSDDQKQLRLLHRNLTPSWHAEMHCESMRTIEQMYEAVFICRYACTKDGSSVTTLKTALDQFINKC